MQDTPATLQTTEPGRATVVLNLRFPRRAWPCTESDTQMECVCTGVNSSSETRFPHMSKGLPVSVSMLWCLFSIPSILFDVFLKQF